MGVLGLIINLNKNMKTYICEICGDAYLGADKPSECPFCGVNGNYIKNGAEAQPLFAREEDLSEETKKISMDLTTVKSQGEKLSQLMEKLQKTIMEMRSL